MSAPYQPAWSNPMGQGMNGMDPNFSVSRQNPNGSWRQASPGNPVNSQFQNSDNPASFIDQLIRREDFPDGPEGDAAYEAALTNFINSGTANVANRTPTQQNIWDAQQASGPNGSSSANLGLQSWATNHPEEALNAIMAMNPGTGEGFLDDYSYRQIVAGLGGIQAVNQMIAERRGEMVASGQIPTEYGGQFANDGVQYTDIGNGHYAGSDGNVYVRDADGNIVPAPTTPQGPASPRPGEIGPSPSRTDSMISATITPPNTVHTTAPGSGSEQRQFPNQGPGMVGATQQPYQMQQNGEVVGSEPIEGGYQYSQVGQDAFLDVTDPATGQVHRFTGDVVEAAYTAAGVASFDEMVARYGYGSAVDMLFSFIAPPPPAKAPAPATAAPTGAPDGGVYTPTPPAPAVDYYPEPTGPSGTTYSPTLVGTAAY